MPNLTCSRTSRADARHRQAGRVAHRQCKRVVVNCLPTANSSKQQPGQSSTGLTNGKISKAISKPPFFGDVHVRRARQLANAASKQDQLYFALRFFIVLQFYSVNLSHYHIHPICLAQTLGASVCWSTPCGRPCKTGCITSFCWVYSALGLLVLVLVRTSF